MIGSVAILLAAKSAAYIAQFTWLLRGGAAKLRVLRMHNYRVHGPDWFAEQWRDAYQGEIATGRRRWLSERSDLWKRGDARVIRWWGHVFKTHWLLLLSAVGCFAAGTWSPRRVAAVAAILIVATTLLMLAAPLLNRITLGPLDQFNADLTIGRASDPKNFGSRLYPGASALARYFATLIALSIVGFSTAYALLAHSDPRAFVTSSGGAGVNTTDPVRWIYFGTTAGSTVGFGDIHPALNIAKLFVTGQLAAGALVLTWIGTFFTSDRLPKRDDAAWDWIAAGTDLVKDGDRSVAVVPRDWRERVEKLKSS